MERIMGDRRTRVSWRRLHVGAGRWLAALANFGAIIGIIVVVVQLGLNRAQLRAQTRHELAATLAGMLDADGRDPQLADVLIRAAKGAPLSEGEQYQVTMRCNAYLRYWEDVSYQHRNGLYAHVEFERQQRAWARLMRESVGLRECWRNDRESYSPEFEREMDAIVAKASPRS